MHLESSTPRVSRSSVRRSARRFGLGVAAVIGLGVPLVPALPVQLVSAASVVPGSSAFTSVSPARLADTRAESGAFGFTRLDANTIRIQVAGRSGVPANASAAVLNITAVGAQAAGFVTAFPSGTAIPGTSTLNVDQPGQVIANLVTVPLGTDGAVQLYSNVAVDLVVDVAGAYAPVTNAVSAGRLVTIAGGAARVLDTRTGGFPVPAGGQQYVPLDTLGIPADATAVVLTVIATEAKPGFWTVFPALDPKPTASNLNIDQPGQTRSAQAVVRLSPGARGVQVFSQSGGHLVVDVAGWYTGSASPAGTDGLFVPLTPVRVLDTRSTFAIAPWGDSTFEVSSGSPLPAVTGAVAMNITLTDPLYMGYITAYPAGVARPFTSNLNATGFDQTIANHAIVRVGTRGIALYTQSGAQLVADVTGWFTGTPEASVLPVPENPSYDPSSAQSISAPGVGVSVGVGYQRNINTVINSGNAGLWGGSGGLGTPEQNVLFAHRTSHGGPFRNLDQMTVGSRFELIGTDGRAYIYLVVSQEVIVPRTNELLAVVLPAGEVTATLVACHPPGSTKYRITVTGRLIGVRD